MRPEAARILTLILAVVTVVLPSVPVTAGTPPPLFLDVTPDGDGGEPPLGFAIIYDADVDLAFLQNAPAEITVDLPNGDSFIASLDVFKTRQGFDELDVPIPSTPPEGFSYLWAGSATDRTVIVTIHHGGVYGSIITPDSGYALSEHRGKRELLLLAANELPDEDVETPPEALPPELFESIPASIFKATPLLRSTSLSREAVDGEITVLAIYEESARLQTGGDPMDQNDAEGITGIIRLAVDKLNMGIFYSGVIERFVLVGPERIDDFDLTGFGRLDLRNIRLNGIVQALREKHFADVVSVFLRNSGSLGAFAGCGQAYTQRPGCEGGKTPDCGVGAEFSEYSFHYLGFDCDIVKHTMSHEAVHNLGCEHNPEATSILPKEASFADSFGHVHDFSTPMFRTIMGLGVEIRILKFSNPGISHGGNPTGVEGVSNCAETIRQLGDFVRDFRSPIVFKDGFESGDTTTWSMTITNASSGEPTDSQGRSDR
jgi:hypothetical protein